MRQESADTQEFESCQQNDMDVDVDANEEELSFIPNAVSVSAGWHQTEGFKYLDIASAMVEGDGEPHTVNLCKNC